MTELIGNSPSVDYHSENARVSSDRPDSRRGSATLALLLGLLLSSSSLFFLAAPVRSLLLRPVMRVRLFVVVPALAAEEEENGLSIFRHHCPSLVKGGAGCVPMVSETNAFESTSPSTVSPLRSSPSGICLGSGKAPSGESVSSRTLATLRSFSVAFGVVSIKIPENVSRENTILPKCTFQPAPSFPPKANSIWLANIQASKSPRYVNTLTLCPANCLRDDAILVARSGVSLLHATDFSILAASSRALAALFSAFDASCFNIAIRVSALVRNAVSRCAIFVWKAISKARPSTKITEPIFGTIGRHGRLSCHSNFSLTLLASSISSNATPITTASVAIQRPQSKESILLDELDWSDRERVINAMICVIALIVLASARVALILVLLWKK